MKELGIDLNSSNCTLQRDNAEIQMKEPEWFNTENIDAIKKE